MKDGRAATRKEIEQQSAGLLATPNQKNRGSWLTTEYDFLNSLSAKDQVCVGIKRGLMGDLTRYVHMAVIPPPRSRNGTDLDNTVAIRSIQHSRQRKRKQRTAKKPDPETE